MAKTVAILGASGVYARHLIPRLAGAGHGVRALVRRPEAAGVARGCGADVRIADIFDAASLRSGLAGADVGINLATSLPGPSGRGDYAVNDRVRREGAPRWVEACRAAGVGRIVQQSIAMVNANGAELADEDTPFVRGENEMAAKAVEASIDMEAAIRGSGLDWLILRGGLFYGPGTGFDDDWFARAAAGKLRLSGDGTDYVSLVHIADMAAATAAALDKGVSGRALIVADDAPAQWRDVFGYVADVVGGRPPATGGRQGFPSFRVSNQRAKEVLGWAPRYADFRAGLVR
jgi:nucleoside-diphosphate-sugar epimerase